MNNKLKNFPISLFAIIMGLSGLSIATQRIESFTSIPKIHEIIGIFTAFLYAIFIVLYGLKLSKFPTEVKHELNHPVKRSFFATISVSMILLSIVFLEEYTTLSFYLLVIGMLSHLLFTLYILSVWIRHEKINVNHKNPAWFIPIVGNILVPIPAMIHFHEDVSWFFFSIGFILWIVLFTIFIYRAIFHQPLPDKLLPTFFILIAPPAIGFISIVKMTGELNGFSKMLYFFALFTAMLLFYNSDYFSKIKFYLSWWAYSFPIAALTIASFLMYSKTQFVLFQYITLGLYIFLVILILYLIIKTISLAIKGKICIPEED